MSFKVGNKVVSLINGKADENDPDVIGTVVGVTETEVIVQPDNLPPFITFSYDLNGQHEQPRFSIKKLDKGLS